MAVIGTRRATSAPMPPPTAMPSTTRAQPRIPEGGAMNSVVTTAIAMPIMPKRLPWREVVGCERPRSARMKRTPAMR